MAVGLGSVLERPHWGFSALSREQNTPLSERGGPPHPAEEARGVILGEWLLGGWKGKEARNRSKHFFPTPHKTSSCRCLQGEVDFGRCIFFLFHPGVGGQPPVLFVFHARRPHPHIPSSGNSAFQRGCVRAQWLSHVQLFATPRTVAGQAPLSVEFCREEYWRGLPCPPPGDLPHPGIEPTSLMSPALAGGFFTTSATCQALNRWIDRCC